jgi:CRP-like cAMP-binding protein
MSIAPSHHDPRANYLLAAMPVRALERIVPHLQSIRADQGDVLIYADEPVERVFFPTSGLFSMVVRSSDGEAIEAAVAGREGMLGTAVVLGSAASTFEELCQIEDGVVALPAWVLREEIDSEPAVRTLLLRYVGTLMHAMARNVACNRLHVTEQRLARWLLQVRDRVESDTFFLTQEFLGVMLGVRRPTVTEAVGALEQRGLLRHQRGRIRLLDEEGLLAAACEDYGRIRDSYAALLAG